MSITAILDTNVVVSGIFWKGPPFQILRAWQQQRFRLAVSAVILDEYRRVLNELSEKHASPAADSIMDFIRLRANHVEPVAFKNKVCTDGDDDKFLEAAVAARANYVVSGDAALLRLKAHEGIQVVKPAEFLRLLSL